MNKNKPEKLSDQLRQIIDDSGISRYAICKSCETDQSAMCRFMSGERGLSTENLDKIGEFLDLQLSMRKPKTTKGGK
jgi:hypothetical protein